MSFRVKAIGRWMHHDCSSRLTSTSLSPSLTCRRGVFSFRTRKPPTLRARRTISPRPAHRPSIPSLPHPSLHRCSSQLARASTEVLHVEDAPRQTLNAQEATAEQDASPAASLWRKAKSTSGKLTPTQQAFHIELTRLPINDQFVDHPGTFPTLSWHFSSLFSNVFRSYCQKTSIEELRQEFAKEICAADTVWNTHSLDSLTNWVDYTFDSNHRAWNIVNLLVGSILKSARQIIHVLNTLKPLDGDFAVRAHCLYLTGFLYKSQLLQDKDLMQMYDTEVHKLRLTQRWPQSAMNLDHMRMLLWRSNGAQIKPLITSLRRKYLAMNVWTLLYLTMFCSRNGLPDEAFSFLNTVHPHFLQDPPILVLKCCFVLLEHDYVVDTEAGPNFRYLPPLLAKGLAPDSLLYHRIIERALASDYAAVAWDIYHHLQTTNISIYWRTYHVLLRHAFNSRDDHHVHEIMSQIHQRKELYTNPALLMYAMNMVRKINSSSKEMTAAEGLSHILALYDRAYTRAPLSLLGIASTSQHQAPTAELAEPDTYVLSFTVWAFILCHKHGRSVQHLWMRIKNLVENGDQIVLECMKRDLIYNALIWLQLKHNETISDALEVLQYMLEKQFCHPTPRTWSIMICGFLHLGQRVQAKQIYDLMCEHGYTIDNICEEYVTHRITLADLEGRANEVLDEQNMPDGTDLHWAEDKSHPADLQAPQGAMPAQSFGSDVEPGDMLYDTKHIGQMDGTPRRVVAAQ